MSAAFQSVKREKTVTCCLQLPKKPPGNSHFRKCKSYLMPQFFCRSSFMALVTHRLWDARGPKKRSYLEDENENSCQRRQTNRVWHVAAGRTDPGKEFILKYS